MNTQIINFTVLCVVSDVPDTMQLVTKYMDKINSNVPMTSRDKRKVGDKLTKALGADKAKRFGNMSRISQVLALIEKVQKLSPYALDNPDLQGLIINELWVVYADIEANGLDDAHFIESHIPCNEYGAGWIFYQPGKKRFKRSVCHSERDRMLLRLAVLFQASVA